MRVRLVTPGLTPSVGFKYVTIEVMRVDMGMCTYCRIVRREGGAERCRDGCDERVRDEVKKLSKRPEPNRARAWPD